MAELPSGTVTFLFTDLEGSTRLWEEHPDAMRDALARHDEFIREPVVGNRGHVVKTTGDGLLIEFSSLANARSRLAAKRQRLVSPMPSDSSRDRRDKRPDQL